jgi:hypothetical protein
MTWEDPSHLNSKNVFEWLNNYPCKLIQSSAQLCKKHNSRWFFVWIVLDTGSNLFPFENKKIRQRLLSQKSAKHCTLFILQFFSDSSENW